MISNTLPVNSSPEVKVNRASQENKIPANIKVYDKKGQVLGKDDFLKLFVTQLSKQDPMNPVSDKEFIAQMAQFSALEQMNNVSANMNELKSMQAGMMVGKLITGKDALNGNVITGEVTRIIYDNSGNIFLRTKDNTVQMRDVMSVENIVKENKENIVNENAVKKQSEKQNAAGLNIDDKNQNTVENETGNVSRETIAMANAIKRIKPLEIGAVIFKHQGAAEYGKNANEIIK